MRGVDRSRRPSVRRGLFIRTCDRAADDKQSRPTASTRAATSPLSSDHPGGRRRRSQPTRFHISALAAGPPATTCLCSFIWRCSGDARRAGPCYRRARGGRRRRSLTARVDDDVDDAAAAIRQRYCASSHRTEAKNPTHGGMGGVDGGAAGGGGGGRWRERLVYSRIKRTNAAPFRLLHSTNETGG